MTAAVRGTMLRAALRATGDGVGCHYRLRAEIGLGVETLAGLGLVKPIRQRIPDCDEHACPLRTECRFVSLFAEGRPGRSGKKYRLAPLGEQALTDDEALAQLAGLAHQLPLARRILAALAADGGTLTIFALNTALLDESLAALASAGEFGEAVFSRGELAATLTLLAALDLIGSDGYHVTLRMAAAA